MDIKSNKLVALVILMAMTVPSKCYSSEANNIKIQSGLKLVETFYRCLGSDTIAPYCSNLFASNTFSDNYGPKSIWSALKFNKNLFLKQNEVTAGWEDFKKSRKSFTFFNPPDINNIESGYMYITLVHNMPEHFYSGIYKEISFPIVKDEKSGEYRIDCLNIKVNGIIIDL